MEEPTDEACDPCPAPSMPEQSERGPNLRRVISTTPKPPTSAQTPIPISDADGDGLATLPSLPNAAPCAHPGSEKKQSLSTNPAGLRESKSLVPSSESQVQIREEARSVPGLASVIVFHEPRLASVTRVTAPRQSAPF